MISLLLVITEADDIQTNLFTFMFSFFTVNDG